MDPLFSMAVPIAKSVKKTVNDKSIVAAVNPPLINGGGMPRGTGNSIQYAETGGKNISPEQFFKEETIAEEMYE